MDPVLFGLYAGTSPSPHTAGVLWLASRTGRGAAFPFLFGALAWDALLVTVLILLGAKTGSLELAARHAPALRMISGVYLIYLGAKALRGMRASPAARPASPPPARPGRHFLSGMGVQAINPNPYLFWAVIGLPRIAAASSALGALSFVATFFSTLYLVKASLLEGGRRLGGTPLASKRWTILRQCLCFALIAWGGTMTLRSL